MLSIVLANTVLMVIFADHSYLGTRVVLWEVTVLCCPTWQRLCIHLRSHGLVIFYYCSPLHIPD